MISCSLQAGLGNLLFQTAAMYSLALDNNLDFALDFSNHYLPLQGNNISKYRNNLFANISQLESILPNRYSEPDFTYTPLPVIDNCVYSGYFQSYKYFDHHREKIQNLFRLEPVFSYNYDWTCVHVRRGDYLKFPDVHTICSKEYYQEAMDLIGGKFIFVSDDMEWVKKNFAGPNITYSIFNDDLLDFKLMSYCNNNIISNSSFSYWAAYLNKNKNNRIIRPSRWFGPNGPSSKDICPPEWITI